MLTLSFGFKKPQTNDKANVVFPALEANFQQLNDHDHDGSNSKKLDGASMESTVVTVTSAGWSALGDGYYEQTVNVPTGIDYDKATVQVKLSTGEIFYPKVTRVSAAQIKIQVSDNTLNNLQVCFN